MCGRSRNMIGPGVRSLVHEKHLIFFSPIASFEGRPVILRILHQRRNQSAVTYLDDLEG